VKHSTGDFWGTFQGERDDVVDCLDFEGFFLLFEASETEKIGIRIEKK